MSDCAGERERRLQELPLDEPPAPWSRRAVLPVAGLLAVGYGEGSDLLLVLSESGRTVVDALTGERLVRDYNAVVPSHEECLRLVCPGFGPLEGEDVRMAGAWGGGLPLQTEDGWRLQRVALGFGREFVVLGLAPEDPNEDEPEAGVRVAPAGGAGRVRAFGFSPTGDSFVVAAGSEAVEVFAQT